MIVSPARLLPVFSTRPWGSRSLKPYFPEKSGLAEPVGEAWMTGHDSRFANGPFSGQALRTAWPQMAAGWRGTSLDPKGDFPLLVKFLFTEDKLSLQVHPDDIHAAQYEMESGGRGKTEMWYALRARSGAEVMVGLRPEVTAEDFRRCLDNGAAEECLIHVPMQTGDAIFVPAGAAHAIGPGLLLCEIQQHSDITYRVYDYNRPGIDGKLRPLHIEKALQVMHFGPQKGGKIEPVRVRHKGVTETYLAACPYFATAKWEFSEAAFQETDPGHFDLLIFIKGHGEIHWHGQDSAQRAAYRPTEVWLVPACLGRYRLEPSSRTALLRTYVPPNLKELAAELASCGMAESEISRLIHS